MDILLNGVPSNVQLGTPGITTPNIITLNGVPSGVLFGVLSVSHLIQTINYGTHGIPSTKAFGNPTILRGDISVLLSGFENTKTLPSFTVSFPGQSITLNGIPSSINLSTGAQITTSKDIFLSGFENTKFVPGLSSLSTNYNVALTGIPSSVSIPTEMGIKNISFVLKVKDPPSGHVPLFSAGDILRMKGFTDANNISDVWMEIISVNDPGAGLDYYEYLVDRKSGDPGRLPAGTGIINYGPNTGSGYIKLTSDESFSPFIEIATHTGTPWSSITPHIRLGNLDGVLGLGLEWGLAAGTDLSDTSNTAKRLVASDQGVRLYNIDLQLWSGANQTVNLTNLGDLKLGSNVANSATTGFYFDRSTGDLLIGQTTKNYMKWDQSDGVLEIHGSANLTGAGSDGRAFYDNFVLQSLYHWNAIDGVGELSFVSGGIAGGYYLSMGNNSGNDYIRIETAQNITFDPNVLYKVSVIAKQIVGAASRMYVGFNGIAADGVTRVNRFGISSLTSPHYAILNQVVSTTDFTEYVGYIGGVAATGVDGSSDPNNAGVFHENVRFIRPLILGNAPTGSTGTLAFDSISVERIAKWDADIQSIPTTLRTPSGNGLYLSPTNMGYYKSSVWTTYMDNAGNFYLGGSGGTLQFTESSGNLLVGDTANANLLWNQSAGQLQFRDTTTVQAYVDTDGAIKAGGGVVRLNSGGIEVELAGYTPGGQRAYSFKDAASSVVGEISGVGSPGTGHSIDLYALSLTGEDSDIGLWSTSPSSNAAKITLQANNITNFNRLTMATTYSQFTKNVIFDSGIQIGADTQLLRGAANKLYTPDSLDIAGTLTVDTIDVSLAALVTINDDLKVAGYIESDSFINSGKMKAGDWIGNTAHMAIAHEDLFATSASYALLQSSAGITQVNAASGQQVKLRVNNSDIVTVGASQIDFKTSIGTTWTALTLGTGWANFGAPYNGAQYKKIGDMVFVKGLVKRTSGTVTVLGNIPVNFRPPSSLVFPAVCSGAALARIDVQTDGDIELVSGDPGTYLDINIWFSID